MIREMKKGFRAAKGLMTAAGLTALVQTFYETGWKYVITNESVRAVADKGSTITGYLACGLAAAGVHRGAASIDEALPKPMRGAVGTAAFGALTIGALYVADTLNQWGGGPSMAEMYAQAGGSEAVNSDLVGILQMSWDHSRRMFHELNNDIVPKAGYAPLYLGLIYNAGKWAANAISTAIAAGDRATGGQP